MQQNNSSLAVFSIYEFHIANDFKIIEMEPNNFFKKNYNFFFNSINCICSILRKEIKKNVFLILCSKII